MVQATHDLHGILLSRKDSVFINSAVALHSIIFNMNATSEKTDDHIKKQNYSIANLLQT